MIDNKIINMIFYKVVVRGTNSGPWSINMTEKEKATSKYVFFADERNINIWIREAVRTYGDRYEFDLVCYRVKVNNIDNVIYEPNQIVIRKDAIISVTEKMRVKINKEAV